MPRTKIVIEDVHSQRSWGRIKYIGVSAWAVSLQFRQRRCCFDIFQPERMLMCRISSHGRSARASAIEMRSKIVVRTVLGPENSEPSEYSFLSGKDSSTTSKPCQSTSLNYTLSQCSASCGRHLFPPQSACQHSQMSKSTCTLKQRLELSVKQLLPKNAIICIHLCCFY